MAENGLPQRYKELADKWNEIRNNGSKKAIYADGTVMNLIRNDILQYVSKNNLTLAVPPITDPSYMAQGKRQILEAARAVYERVSKNADIKWLEINQVHFSQKEQREFALLCGYEKLLKTALQKQDYVLLRMYGNGEVLEAFEKQSGQLAAEVRINRTAGKQVSLFDT